jgi:hypothetical protein
MHLLECIEDIRALDKSVEENGDENDDDSSLLLMR